MAAITEMNSDKLENGTRLPAVISNRWKLGSVDGLSNDEFNIIAEQYISLEYKFNAPHYNSFGFVIDEKHDLLLVIEESVNNDIASIVSKLMEGKHDISFQNLDGHNTVMKKTMFRGCTAIGYTYKMDYGKSETCKFPIKFKCESIIYS
jgi:hypothetical protein